MAPLCSTATAAAVAASSLILATAVEGAAESLRVIGAGMGRTGTDSLRNALDLVRVAARERCRHQQFSPYYLAPTRSDWHFPYPRSRLD